MDAYQTDHACALWPFFRRSAANFRQLRRAISSRKCCGHFMLSLVPVSFSPCARSCRSPSTLVKQITLQNLQLTMHMRRPFRGPLRRAVGSCGVWLGAMSNKMPVAGCLIVRQTPCSKCLRPPCPQSACYVLSRLGAVDKTACLQVQEMMQLRTAARCCPANDPKARARLNIRNSILQCPRCSCRNRRGECKFDG